MFCGLKPNLETLSNFLASQKMKDLSYREVGATSRYYSKDQLEPESSLQEYDFDCHKAKLGIGESVFRLAVQGLCSWKQFDLEWVQLYPPNAPIAVGETVAIAARSLRAWTLSACRIVYVINEADEKMQRFGFAYGTLETHVEQGEELFVIEWNKLSGNVTFEIRAFSLPHSWFTRLAHPVARYFQKCFSEEALTSLQDYVKFGDAYSKETLL